MCLLIGRLRRVLYVYTKHIYNTNRHIYINYRYNISSFDWTILDVHLDHLTSCGTVSGLIFRCPPKAYERPQGRCKYSGRRSPWEPSPPDQRSSAKAKELTLTGANGKRISNTMMLRILAIACAALGWGAILWVQRCFSQISHPKLSCRKSFEKWRFMGKVKRFQTTLKPGLVLRVKLISIWLMAASPSTPAAISLLQLLCFSFSWAQHHCPGCRPSAWGSAWSSLRYQWPTLGFLPLGLLCRSVPKQLTRLEFGSHRPAAKEACSV